MHGVIPPESSPPGGEALAAVAQGWSSFAGSRTATRRASPERADRLPTPLLALAQALLDALCCAVPGLLARDLAAQGAAPAAGVVLLGIGIALFAAACGGAYAHAALFGSRRAMLACAAGLAGAVLGLGLAAPLMGAPDALPPATAGMWLVFGVPLLLAARLASARLVRAEARRTALRAVVVGDGPHAARLTAGWRRDAGSPVRLVGVVEDRQDAAESPFSRCGLPHLGTMDALSVMIRRGEVDRVILALPWSAEARAGALARRLAEYPVEVCLAPDLLCYAAEGALPSPRLLARPIGPWAAVLKRAEDILLALGALAVAAVPMLLIALAIRMDSPGPVLFRQRRTGFNNRDFYVLKFRTMYAEATDHEARVQVQEGDPRVTPVGSLLRRTSLDELPQLLNVLRGEMSFVGPRPHAPGTRAGGRLFEEVDERYAARHRVKPGLTGLAQVRGWRGPTETEEKLVRRVDSDLEYIENWSLWLDFTIIIRTLVAVARMRNAC